ncbi:MAG: c-type cytochrome [Flammeovirgaceae bacterium]
MFKKEGLILNVLLAAIAGFLMNYAIYQIPPIEETTIDDESYGYCVVIEPDHLANLPAEFQGLASQGEEIFEANCTQCHAMDMQVVGPALKDVHKRWLSHQKLTQFIRFPQHMIEVEKEPYAVALFQKYQQFMPNHEFLTDEDMDALLIYLNAHPSQVTYADSGIAVSN